MMTNRRLFPLIGAAIALGLLHGCGDRRTPTEGALLKAGDAPRFSDWSAPVHLGPDINSASTELEVAVSRDGLSLYLSSNRPGGSGGFDIWVSRRASLTAPWGVPQNLGSVVNTSAREQGPFLSPDGHRLYFFSDRPGGVGGLDLYVTRRRDAGDDAGWETPVNLGGNVNTTANESLPVLFEDGPSGATLYFISNVGGQPDIYVAQRRGDQDWGPASVVAELSSPRRDRILTVGRDGLEIFLASDRPGPAAAPFDLWVATRDRTTDPWADPTNLGPLVNSPTDEGGATLSWDGTALYLTTDRPGGLGSHDIWVSKRTRLDQPD